MNRRFLTRFLLLAVLQSVVQWAQAGDAHAGHVMPPSLSTSESASVSVPTSTSAPAMADAASMRDPQAYSGGYTLDAGPYVLAGPRQLHLADEHHEGGVLVDRLEQSASSDDGRDDGQWSALNYDARAWMGTPYHKLVLHADGEYNEGRRQKSSADLLYDKAVASFWDIQAGVRIDDASSSGQWLALGVRGLAPYWFDVDAMVYLGKSGHVALSLDGDYEWLLTQRLIMQASAGLQACSRRDEAMVVGSGVSAVDAGLRWRYEFSRQFAPYLGVEWQRRLGETADMAEAVNADVSEMRYLAGVRFWF